MIQEYDKESVRKGYWEDVYIQHIKELPMQVRRYPDNDLFEFDTLDELREFDDSYVDDPRSAILKEICSRMSWKEKELSHIKKIKMEENDAIFTLDHQGVTYKVSWTPVNMIIDRL